MKILLLSSFVILCSVSCTYAGEADEVFATVRSSIVTITTLDERNQPEGAGSGVVISPSRVVTNCHVVNEANSIQILAGEKKLSAKLVAGDLKRDICLLHVPELSAPAATFRASDDLQKGESVYAVGNPLGFGLSVSAGLISTLSRKNGETKIFTSAPISPGCDFSRPFPHFLT